MKKTFVSITSDVSVDVELTKIEAYHRFGCFIILVLMIFDDEIYSMLHHKMQMVNPDLAIVLDSSHLFFFTEMIAFELLG